MEEAHFPDFPPPTAMAENISRLLLGGIFGSITCGPSRHSQHISTHPLQIPADKVKIPCTIFLPSPLLPTHPTHKTHKLQRPDIMTSEVVVMPAIAAPPAKPFAPTPAVVKAVASRAAAFASPALAAAIARCRAVAMATGAARCVVRLATGRSSM